MFANENVGLLGATDKKEKKKVIKMKDVFVIPNHLKEKYNKKEKQVKLKKDSKKTGDHPPHFVANKHVKDFSKKMDSQMHSSKKMGDGYSGKH